MLMEECDLYLCNMPLPVMEIFNLRYYKNVFLESSVETVKLSYEVSSQLQVANIQKCIYGVKLTKNVYVCIYICKPFTRQF